MRKLLGYLLLTSWALLIVVMFYYQAIDAYLRFGWAGVAIYFGGLMGACIVLPAFAWLIFWLLKDE